MTFDLTMGMQVLERTPRTLQAMLDGLVPGRLDSTEGADTWSPRVVVGHLIQAERTNWIPRAQILLQQGSDCRFRPFDRLPDANAIGTNRSGSCFPSFPRYRDAIGPWRAYLRVMDRT